MNQVATFEYTKGMLKAEGNTYPLRSLLKSFGFRWQPEGKFWMKDCDVNTADQVITSFEKYTKLDRVGAMKWKTV